MTVLPEGHRREDLCDSAELLGHLAFMLRILSSMFSDAILCASHISDEQERTPHEHQCLFALQHRGLTSVALDLKSGHTTGTLPIRRRYCKYLLNT